MKHRILQTGKRCFIPQYKSFLFWRTFLIYPWKENSPIISFSSLDGAKSFLSGVTKRRIEAAKYPKIVYRGVVK